MDIALAFENNFNNFDIQLNGADLLVNHDLLTSVIMSLYCYRRAAPDDLIDGSNPQGWWGDSYAAVQGYQLGSRLWLLSRQKNTQNNANLARQYCLEALQWLIDDQVASSVQVETEIIDYFTLAIGVTINKPTSVSNFKFNYVWSQF